MLTRDWGLGQELCLCRHTLSISEHAPFTASVGDCVSHWLVADGVALAVRAQPGPGSGPGSWISAVALAIPDVHAEVVV